MHSRTTRTLTDIDSYTQKNLCQAADKAAAIFSATARVLRFVFARGMVGMTEASATYRFSWPSTAPLASTTEPSAHVPTGWK